MTPHRDHRPSAGRLVAPTLATTPATSHATAGRGPEMDGPELIARDLALLATSNPEAFWSALHELHDALAKGAHPDAGLRALCEAVHAGPPDAALGKADDRLATVEELIATLVPATGAGLAV